MSAAELYKNAVKAKSKNLDEAKRLATLAANKNYPPAHKMLGQIYQTEMNYKKAVFHFKKYVELAPNAPDAGVIKSYIQQLESM